MTLEFLLTRWARLGDHARTRDGALDTFCTWRAAGIYDQIGGGFARYSVDARWLVPHFEKMLYDNALLVRFGAHLWQATKDAEVRRVTHRDDRVARARDDVTRGRVLLVARRGFRRARKASSTSGRCDELDAVLGDGAPLARAHWGVTRAATSREPTSFTSHDRSRDLAATRGIAESQARDELAIARARLRVAREQRVRPGRDEKILAMWNGLDDARARRSRVRSLATMRARSARRACSRVARTRDHDATAGVLRSYKDGVARIDGFLEDYARSASRSSPCTNSHSMRLARARARALGDAHARSVLGCGSAYVLRYGVGCRAAHHTAARRHRQRAPIGTFARRRAAARCSPIISGDPRLTRHRRTRDRLGRGDGRSYPQAFGHLLTAADAEVFGAPRSCFAGARRRTRRFARLRGALASRYVPSLRFAHAGDDVAFARDRGDASRVRGDGLPPWCLFASDGRPGRARDRAQRRGARVAAAESTVYSVDRGSHDLDHNRRGAQWRV